MQFFYSDFFAALPGFIGTDAVRTALKSNATISATGELPVCPAPVMLRRRLSSLGKLVISALDSVAIKEEEPFVVASSWGDSRRTLELTQEMLDTGDVSPAGFTANVHNANSGIAGIWLKNHAPAPAISADNFTTEAGLTECQLLLEHHPSVILVRAEAPLPELWSQRSHQLEAPDYPYVWAMRLVKKGVLNSFSIVSESLQGNQIASESNPLSDLAFLLNQDNLWVHANNNRRWTWRK